MKSLFLKNERLTQECYLNIRCHVVKLLGNSAIDLKLSSDNSTLNLASTKSILQRFQTALDIFELPLVCLLMRGQASSNQVPDCCGCCTWQDRRQRLEQDTRRAQEWVLFVSKWCITKHLRRQLAEVQREQQPRIRWLGHKEKEERSIKFWLP